MEHGESRKDAHRLVLDEGTHLSGNFERHFVLGLFDFGCDWGIMYARYEMCSSSMGGAWGVLYIYIRLWASRKVGRVVDESSCYVSDQQVPFHRLSSLGRDEMTKTIQKVMKRPRVILVWLSW